MKKHAGLQELINFLQVPSNYPHHPKEVKIIQTHASILAMAPPYVYKFKKPLDFGFMDFRSLEARKKNSERELALNRRLCKEIYLSVLPVYKHRQQFSFHQKGPVVDYALLMKQMDDGFFLNQLLAKGALTNELLEEVLQVLKMFYEAQSSQADMNQYADLPHLQQNAEDNFASLRKFPPENFAPKALELIEHGMKAFLQQQQALIRKRIEEDKIKDCHGDLHLEHIHIQNQKVCIYDCIEFNERFRYGDIAADIAFLAMDLDFSGRPDLANFVAQRMAVLLQDREMLLLMDYYKSYRACVRAKVENIRSLQQEVAANEQAISNQKAKRYMELALRYKLLGSQPWLIIVCGKIGSGKSTIAERLAELLGISYLSSDIIRKENAGLDVYQRTPAVLRPYLYGIKKTNEVYQQLLKRSLAILHKQHTVLVDATFGKATHRTAFIQALEQHHMHYCFIETQAPEQLIQERLKERENMPVISDARLENYIELSNSYEPLTEVLRHQHISLSTEAPPNRTIDKLLVAFSRLTRKKEVYY